MDNIDNISNFWGSLNENNRETRKIAAYSKNQSQAKQNCPKTGPVNMNNIFNLNNFGYYILPIVIFLIISYGIYEKIPIFDAFLKGAAEGINSTFSIAPTLIGLITAVTMLKSSGTLDIFCNLISPVTNFLGIPTKIIPLALLKPISGSGSLALLNNIFETESPDSALGKIASIFACSTETTFYTVAVYFGSLKLRNYRHTLPCALLIDLCAFVVAVLLVNKFNVF